jgi:hypothetical protein
MEQVVHDVSLCATAFLFGRNALFQNILGVLEELVLISS